MGAGRPTKYRKEFHCDNFITLSEQGKTLAQIAKAWKIDRETLWTWSKKHKEFANAVKRGRQIAEAWYMDLGQASMLGQAKIDGQKVNINLGMFCWLTKNMFRWSDRVVEEKEFVEHDRPLEGLSDEELDKL